MDRRNSTLRPSNLTGADCPGTIQSGPAASKMASVAKPLPIGSGCYKNKIKKVPLESRKQSNKKGSGKRMRELAFITERA